MRWRTLVVGLLLIVMVTAAVVLTIESRRAEKAARETAEHVLRDYAAFAAHQYARIASRSLEQAFNGAIAGRDRAAAECNCDHPAVAGVRAGFKINLATAEWAGVAPARDADRAAVLQHVRQAASDAHRGPRFTVLSDGAVAWHVDEVTGRADVAHGVVTGLSFLEQALGQAAREPVLPPALMSSADASRMLHLRVMAPDGRVLFDSIDRAWHAPTASPPIAATGGLTIAASLAPDAAPHLIIGGLPRPRLLAVCALLGLAAALVLVAGYQLRREAELARLRADFVSGVSHELRTPLAQIRMFAETLRLGRVRSAEETTRALDVILQESQRLSNLAENVLVFTRGERASHHIERTRVSLSALLHEIAADLQPMAHARRAVLTTRITPDIDAAVDADAMRQVVLNLVDNALKYGAAGQTVTLGLQRDEDRVRVWVEDQGPGIPRDDERHIWEPFWRRGKAGQGGSGIGLSIVRDLVQLHGGRVFVDPDYTAGARFVVTLA
jgi:signal transduction histidine kinase